MICRSRQASGKFARKGSRSSGIIAKLASQLAPTQQTLLLVNGYTHNAPIGPGLKQEGIRSNLSQKRAESVMQYLITQGVKPDLVSAHGYGEADPVASNDMAQGVQRTAGWS